MESKLLDQSEHVYVRESPFNNGGEETPYESFIFTKDEC